MRVRTVLALLAGGIGGGGVAFWGGMLARTAYDDQVRIDTYADYVNVAIKYAYKGCSLQGDMVVQCPNPDDAASLDRSARTKVDYALKSGEIGENVAHSMSTLLAAVVGASIASCFVRNPAQARQQHIAEAAKSESWENEAYLQSINFTGETPDEFLDPISFSIMDDPEKTIAGNDYKKTYDKKTVRGLDGKCPNRNGNLISLGMDNELKGQIVSFVNEQRELHAKKLAESKQDGNDVVITVEQSSTNVGRVSMLGFLGSSKSNVLAEPLLAADSELTQERGFSINS